MLLHVAAVKAGKVELSVGVRRCPDPTCSSWGIVFACLVLCCCIARLVWCRIFGSLRGFLFSFSILYPACLLNVFLVLGVKV